jgi:hypothetical protein
MFAVTITIYIFQNLSFAADGKVHPDVIAAAQQFEKVEVIIRLQDQSGHEIAQTVKGQHIPAIDAISSEVRNLERPFLAQDLPLPDDVRQQVKALLEEMDRLTMQMRQDIRAQVWARISNEQQRVREAIENAGGTVHAQIVILNAIGAQLPSDVVNQIASLPEVRFIELDVEGEPELNNSVPTIHASTFWNAGYTGGIFDIGIVDKGVDLDHIALAPHYSAGCKKDPDDECHHGTMIAGIVASTDDTYKGVAFGLDKIVDASFEDEGGFDDWSDAVAAMEWALTGSSDDAEVLVHSYGWPRHWYEFPDVTMDQGDPDYSSKGADLDQIIDDRDNVEQVKLESGSDVSVYVRVHCWYSSGSETFGLAPESSFESVPAPLWWAAPAKDSIVDKKVLQSEKKISALYRNYPNPFNPETWIPFQLASEADVVIRIYNIEGQLVRTLNLGNQPAGTYIMKDKAASWDGKNDEGNLVSSGVYFYTLEANGKKIGTRKMIMLK